MADFFRILNGLRVGEFHFAVLSLRSGLETRVGAIDDVVVEDNDVIVDVQIVFVGSPNPHRHFQMSLNYLSALNSPRKSQKTHLSNLWRLLKGVFK